MKRKLFKVSTSFLLAITMASSIMPQLNVFAASVIPNVTLSEHLVDSEKAVEVDGIKYVITSSSTATTPGTAVVAENKNLSRANIVIPDTISVYNKTYYVTELGANAFSSNHSIKSIKLGKNVEKVSGYAFLDCINLEKIEVTAGNKNLSTVNNILYSFDKSKLIYCPQAYNLEYFEVPKTVKEIGDCAFYSNKYIREVSLNTILESIGNYAFNNCITLTTVNTSNSVKTIGNYAFAQTGIKSILLSRGLTELGEGAFLGTDITTITIPSGVTQIKASTFYNCYDLKGVKLNNNLEEIGDYAFASTGLLSFTMPDSLTSIGYAAFADCADLAKISSNGKLKVIKDNAFYNCNSLLDFVVPTATVEIGNNAFTGCNHIQSFSVSLNNTEFEDEGGILYTKGRFKLVRYPAGKTDVNYIVPYVTTEIAENALADCQFINGFEVESMSKSFAADDGILYDFDKNILYAYPASKVSDNFTIPDYVTKIMPRAFAGSVLQGTLNISNYVSEIGDGAFENCKGISAFNMTKNNDNYTVVDGVLFSKDLQTLVCYPNSKGNTSYTLPETTKTIATAAFKNTKLQEIKLNEGLMTIGDEAFSNSAIKEFTLPSTLVEIGESAFENSSIKSITIPDSVNNIGSLAFANCTALRTVEFLGKDLPKTPGYNIFLNTKLEKIIVPNLLKEDYAQFFTITDANSYENIIK